MTQINTEIIHKSLAAVLSKITPNANIYDNPNQQSTKLPAWFIVHREPVKLSREIGRFWLAYSIDLVYMLEYNRPRLFDEYSAIGAELDEALLYLDIYGSNGEKVHIYENSWGMGLDCMRYSITIRLRVSKDARPDPTIQVISSIDAYLKDRKVD